VLKYSAPFAAGQLHSLTTSISRTLQSLATPLEGIE